MVDALRAVIDGVLVRQGVFHAPSIDKTGPRTKEKRNIYKWLPSFI
jgi:hypothetical protein